MLLELELDRALIIIKNSRIVRKDTVIPMDFPPVSHTPYRPGYDWLFTYERELARFLETWLKDFRHELIGEKGILSEALSNAFCHGNQRDALIPIEISVYQGDLGIIVKIEDSGEGFNVNELRKKFERGKDYFHLAGNGFRRMMFSDNLGVFYNLSGNAFHLLYLFHGNIASLAVGSHKNRTEDKDIKEFSI